jgi:hypothetical protein
MATPTNYTLTYDQPCDVEGGCGSDPCGKPEFNARDQIFCKDISVIGSTDLGQTNIRPSAVTVGGQTFTPLVINTISGPHLVLAVY